MQVRMQRTFRPGEYESFTYDVTVNDADVIHHFEDGAQESNMRHIDRMHLECYKKVLAFEVFHGVKTSQGAARELARFREAYHFDKRKPVGSANGDGGEVTGDSVGVVGSEASAS